MRLNLLFLACAASAVFSLPADRKSDTAVMENDQPRDLDLVDLEEVLLEETTQEQQIVSNHIKTSMQIDRDQIPSFNSMKYQEGVIFQNFPPYLAHSFEPTFQPEFNQTRFDDIKTSWTLNPWNKQPYDDYVPFDAEIVDSSRMPFVTVGPEVNETFFRYVGVNLDYNLVKKIGDYLNETHGYTLQSRGEAVSLSNEWLKRINH